MTDGRRGTSGTSLPALPNLARREPPGAGRSAALGLLLLISACAPKPGSAPTSPPPDVRAVEVLQQNVPLTGEWVGTMEGSIQAEVRAMVRGYLTKQCYNEGMLVQANQLLFEIDARPFQAILDQAKGELGQAQALQRKAELDVERLTPLAQKRAVSREELDDAIQSNFAAKARVEALSADVRRKELDVGFTQIRSPIDGIAGVAHRQVGNLVGGPGGELLAQVATLDPIRVFFPVSEGEFPSLIQVLRPPDAAPVNPAPETLELILEDNSLYPHRGRLAATRLEVNRRTGTIDLVGLFPNPGNMLRPGMYARIRAVVREVPRAVLVPQRAVREFQGEAQVGVLEPGDRVRIRTIVPGARVGSLWLIEKGLEAHERVIVDGLDRVKSGDLVHPSSVSIESLYPQGMSPGSPHLEGRPGGSR